MSNINTINLNPKFIIWDYGIKLIGSSTFMYMIVIFEIVISLFILYFFYENECVFIYNMWFKPTSHADDNTINSYNNKLSNIFSSKLYCVDDIMYITMVDSNNIKATSINGDAIIDCNKLLDSV